MGATAKQTEHHKILSVILREFQEITALGRIKTVVTGKTVFLKCFGQYLIGRDSIDTNKYDFVSCSFTLFQGLSLWCFGTVYGPVWSLRKN